MNLDRCVRRALSHLPPHLQKKFAVDPVGMLRDDLKLSVKRADHLADKRANGGACDGMSFLSHGVILYAPTENSKRENFTLAHELGHWLVDEMDLYDEFANSDQPAKILETVCDHIAQRLLLPAALIDSVVGGGPIRAQHVVDLFGESEASRPVCAIALADRLMHHGAVMIVDRDEQVVTFASVRPDPQEGWPTVFPWPKQQVPGGHPFNTMAAGASLTKKSFWLAPWGGSRAEYYIDAVSDHRRIVAVFSDVDVWHAENIHFDQVRDYDQRPRLTVTCCDETVRVRGYPCPTCREAYCPQCHYCRCERKAQKEQRCTTCFMSFLPHLLEDGLCEICRG